MDKKVYFDKGGYLHGAEDSGNPRLVPFPVCLAIKCGDRMTEECPDFVLNTDDSRVFVNTQTPLSEGTPLLMHFYIPPENKLLAELKGKVATVEQGSEGSPKGMLIEIAYFSRKEMQDLANYFEGKKSLIDSEA